MTLQPLRKRKPAASAPLSLVKDEAGVERTEGSSSMSELAGLAALPGGERTSRLLGIAGTVAIHAVLLALILFVRTSGLEVQKASEMIVSIIAPDTPEAPPEPTEPRPEIKQPIKPDFAILPDIQIDTPPSPYAITVPKGPPPPPPPPSRTRDSYYGRILAHLNRHKRYPDAARLRRQEGVPQVSFVIDRSGRVQSFALAKSCGIPALDEEALALIGRANPLPAIPPELQRESLSLVVPIEFFMH